jgi:superfamily I DNA/RNA helicase
MFVNRFYLAITLQTLRGPMPNKAIRFTDKEYEEIQEFLEDNPLFDFSSLTKFAIASFLNNPQITIKTKGNNEDVVVSRELQ